MPEQGEDDNVSYYDHLANDYSLFFQDLEENMAAEGSWLHDILRRLGAHRILDASCGTGRQAIPLRERGYDVVAADPSRSMLEHAQRAAEEHHVSFPLLNLGFGDISRHLGADFDAVIAMGNGLCHLTNLDEITSALANMRSCCHAGGACIVGIKDFDRVCDERPRFHGRQVHDANGGRQILFEVWDYNDPILACTAFLLTGDSARAEWTTQTATTHEYMLTSSTVEQVARKAGFRAVRRLPHPAEAVFALFT